MDIGEPQTVQRIEMLRPDLVFHLAAQVNVQRSMEDPGLDGLVNIIGTIHVLEGCRLAGVNKLVFASSCAVYGMSEQEILQERDATNPISFYGISKLTAERYIQSYGQIYSLPYTIFRFANVYGPGQSSRGEGGVIPSFLYRIQQGQPLVLYGDGEQTRDFIYVKDVVSALVAARDRGDGHIIQLGSSVKTSVHHLIEQLENIHGTSLKRAYKPARQGEIRDSLLDRQKAAKLLQWQPQYSLLQGLRETYAHVMRS